MSRPFLQKVVLVTGAGSGIGQEAAKLFAAQGALVYGLEQTQQAIRDDGGRMELAAMDVSDERQASGLLARIEKEAGRLDVAFNNAGIAGGGQPFHTESNNAVAAVDSILTAQGLEADPSPDLKH